MKAMDQILELLDFFEIKLNYMEKIAIEEEIKSFEALIKKHPFFKDIEITIKEVIEEDFWENLIFVFEDVVNQFSVLTKDGKTVPAKEFMKGKERPVFGLKLPVNNPLNCKVVTLKDLEDVNFIN